MRISDLKKEAAKAASFLTFEIGSNYTRVSKDVPHLRRSIVVYASTQPFRGCYETLLPWSGVNSKIRELKYLGYK
jgi:hypothetical protein